jgi:hypothetical protein
MIKTSLIAAGIFTFTAAFAQTTSNHIEIAVSEKVELKPTQAEIQISVQTAQSQRDEKASYYGYSESIYGYDWYEPSEEDYEYEQLMYENPKKVTKKMTQEYEARQKQREEDIAAMELEQMEREREQEAELANFEPFEITAMMALLTENGISYTIVSKNSNEVENSTSESDSWMDYEMTYYSDTILSIVVNDSKAYQNLMLLVSDLPAYAETKDVKFESNEAINSMVIPKLTDKATKEAQALANSFGRKLGKVIQCTNVYPATPSSNYMLNYMGDLSGFMDDSNYNGDGDPFLTTKKEIVEYIYRFELLN